MKSWVSGGRAAGILYLIVAALPLGSLAILVIHAPELSVQDYLSAPDAKPLLGTLIFLGVSSFLMGMLLIWKQRVARHHLAVGVLMAGVAFAWNVVAPVFWVVPLLLAWHARTRS